MRVRPKRTHSALRGPARRKHVVPEPPAATGPAPEAPPPAAAGRHERRARASGGPVDRAQYHCACGYAFSADVSTSVACPHCGAGQAW